MAGLQGVYRTYDNGKTWIETNTGFVGSEVVDLLLLWMELCMQQLII